jgi:O-antigen ligase
MARDFSAGSQKVLTLPVLFLLLFTVFTYFPIIYNYFPILGKIKIVLIIGVIMLLSYLLTMGNYTNRGAQKSIVFRFWTVMALMMVAGLAVSVDRGMTLNIIIASLKYLLVYWVTLNVIDTPRRLNLLLTTFIFCAVGMSLFTIRNYFFDAEMLVGGYRAVALDIGVFGDPNDLALFNNTALPFALYYMMKSKRKYIPLAGITIILTAIILTYSRGGFVGFCATMVAFVLFYATRRRKMIVLFLLLAAFVWNLAPDTYKERIGTITDWKVDEKTGMTGTRMDAWKMVFLYSLNNQPLLGVGAGGSYYMSIIIPGEKMWDWHAIHNTFIQVFSELGIVAFICYVGIYLAPLRQYKKLARSSRGIDLDINRFVLISLASYGTTVMFLPQAYSPLLYTLSSIQVVVMELSNKSLKAESGQA